MRRDRAEALVARPGLIGATGDRRDAVLELRSEAEAALADADDRLRVAAGDRLAAIDRIRRVNRALVGTGQVVDPATGELIQYLRRRSDTVEDPLPDPTGLETIDGRELRDLLVGLLQILDRPAAVSELVRLVAAHGFTPPGRPGQAVSNALRVEMEHGNVGRVAWGRYTAH